MRIRCQRGKCIYLATEVVISVFRDVNGRTSGTKGYYCKTCLKEVADALDEYNIRWETATLFVDKGR